MGVPRRTDKVKASRAGGSERWANGNTEVVLAKRAEEEASEGESP
jgi:hypothetical protein